MARAFGGGQAEVTTCKQSHFRLCYGYAVVILCGLNVRMSDLPFRIETLLEQCGGNRDIGKIVFEEFLLQVAEDSNEIKACLDRGDLIQAGKVAHRLKGSAGVLGADRLHSFCLALETAGKDEDAEDAAKFFLELKAEIERCVAAVPEAQTQL